VKSNAGNFLVVCLRGVSAEDSVQGNILGAVTFTCTFQPSGGNKVRIALGLMLAPCPAPALHWVLCPEMHRWHRGEASVCCVKHFAVQIDGKKLGMVPALDLPFSCPLPSISHQSPSCPSILHLPCTGKGTNPVHTVILNLCTNIDMYL